MDNYVNLHLPEKLSLCSKTEMLVSYYIWKQHVVLLMRDKIDSLELN